MAPPIDATATAPATAGCYRWVLPVGATGGCCRWVLLAGCCWLLLALCSTARRLLYCKMIAESGLNLMLFVFAPGSQKFFWFSQDVSLDYGANPKPFSRSLSLSNTIMLQDRLRTNKNVGAGIPRLCTDFSIFYGGYVPRPRLVALNAVASLLEGHTYSRSFTQVANTFVHLFESSESCVAALWTNSTAVDLTLPFDATKLSAFDTMANPLTLRGSGVEDESSAHSSGTAAGGGVQPRPFVPSPNCLSRTCLGKASRSNVKVTGA